ncbi:MAG: chromosome segregation protein SMC [Candidatus Omnitrophota bacterium]
MYFKKLELFGFKSFAGRTELMFEPGVTAIVGPNGCGKSNIADAIRWVLGEQSVKALRSSSMEDIIFNGTDTKDALNFAEVSFTLSNEERILPIDFDEVMITRRLFRSGESEYLINKTLVRLKDVNELLMGTGIGTEAYSLIEQGKIDLILSSKPEERRFVFEEASGITKYKSKKKEALRKLEQTEQNLLRINDIITEVKRQINSIERQAKKAEVYKGRFEELKNLEVKVGSYEYMKLSGQKVKLEDELKSLLEVTSQAEGAYGELKKNAESLNADFANLEKEIDTIEREDLNIQNQYTLNINKISSNQERIAEYMANIATIENEVTSIQDKIGVLESETQKAAEELQKIIDEKQEKQQKVLENERKLSETNILIKQSTEKIVYDKTSLLELSAQHANVKNELVKLTANLQNISSRRRRLNIEKENVSKEYAALEGRFNISLAELAELKKLVKGIEDACGQVQGKNNAREAEIRDRETSLNKNNTKLAGYESKIEFLLDLKKRHEGFSAGTKILLEALQTGALNSRGVLGVLSEIIEPKRNFELIVERALGGNFEAIVVEKEEDAKRLIDFLKDKQVGFAKFLILSTFTGPLEPSFPYDNATTVPILSLVKNEERLDNLIQHLLGNAYLVKDIDTALALCKDKHTKFITEQKEMVEFGFISAGYAAITEDTSILARESKIKELSELITQLKRENGILEEEQLKAKQEQEVLRTALQAEEENLKRESQRFLTKEKEHENITAGMERLKEELSLVNLEIEEIIEEEEALKKKELSDQTVLLQTESRQKDSEHTLQNLQGVIEQNLKEKERLLLQLTEDRTILGNVSDRESSRRDRLEKLKLDFSEQMTTQELKTQAAVEYNNKLGILKKEIEEFTHYNEHITKTTSRLSEDLTAKVSLREYMSSEIVSLKDSLTSKETEIDSLRKRLQGIEVELAQLNLRCENMKNRINEVYKTELVLDTIDEHFDKEHTIAQIETLKAKLESMGTVNLVAIEEHKELLERYNFLESQRQDLVNAKDSLLKAIAKINKTTKDLFMETFRKIQLEFRNFVRLLFGGGDAELLLIDSEDVLESGIEIVARPPGKRLQNISLLSGGEKALTAIALLFAIFKVKPSPFCVLDEIDAPLDESNVDRFSKVLQDFVKMSQFIIITHNKKTITTADVMYGITMEESGISQIVSVKFGDRKPHQKEPLKETVT